MLWKYTLLWFGLTILAIINGYIRNKFYTRFLGSLKAHQVSTISLLILVGVYTWIFTNLWVLESAGQALIVGSIWVSITIVFEFVFGHYIMKKPWQVLFHDYNILKGRIWLLVLIWTFFAPFTFFHLNP